MLGSEQHPTRPAGRRLPGKEPFVKKKSPKKLKLNAETLTRMELEEVAGGETVRPCQFSAAYTNCPMCGQTNYITCLNC
jgi:hypothetical protein